MPISNKASENRMTRTTIRVDPYEAQQRQQAQNKQVTTFTPTNNSQNQTKISVR